MLLANHQPHNGYSSTYPGRIVVSKCRFLRGGETGVPREDHLGSKDQSTNSSLANGRGWRVAGLKSQSRV